MSRGKFITLEGIEGTGKSTNVDLLSALIKAEGFDVVCTREPGGTPMAEAIRHLILDHEQEPLPEIAELLLFFAARSLHLRNTIEPALERGAWVICDRFTDASRAYQGGGRGLDANVIEKLADWVQQGLEPDLTLLLDAPAETGVARAHARGDGDRMDNEAIEFYRRVRASYLLLAEQHRERFAIINADQPLADVQADVAEVMARKFSSTFHQ